MKLVFLSFFLLCSLILLVNSATQLIGCNTTDFCTNVQTRLVCSGDTAASDDTLRWRIRDNNNSIFQSAAYDEGQTAVGEDSRIIFINSYFNAILTSNANPMRSNLSFNPLLVLNKYTVQCTVDTTVSCRIMVPDPPAPFEINEVVITPTYVSISWPISTHPCFEEYRLLTRSADNPNTLKRIFDRSITNILLSISQLNDTEYSYSVYVSDTGGRFIEPQVVKMLTLNVPLSVANLMLTQTEYPTDTNDTVNITVSWNEQQSSRPPITQYNVQCNISNGLHDISTNVTSLTLSGFSVGSVYAVSVEAVNVLGTGTAASATISIRSTPSMTPSNSPTPTNQALPFSSSVIAGIAFALIVLATLVKLGIVFVCYVKKKNQDKPDISVAPQATTYAQVDHSVSAKSSSSKRQAPPNSAIQKPKASHNPPPQVRGGNHGNYY